MSSALQLTADQFEQMRHLLSLHDAQTAGKGAREFDLNNPPHVQYRHQEYPCAMYNHETGEIRRCADAEAQEDLEAEGWTREAIVAVAEAPVPLSAAEAEEASRIDAQLIRKPGRSRGSRSES